MACPSGRFQSVKTKTFFFIFSDGKNTFSETEIFGPNDCAKRCAIAAQLFQFSGHCLILSSGTFWLTHFKPAAEQHCYVAKLLSLLGVRPAVGKRRRRDGKDFVMELGGHSK